MGRQSSIAKHDKAARPGDDKQQLAALMQQAERAFQSNKLDHLESILDEVLEIDPDHIGALYNRGILHRDKDELYGAETCFRRALKLDPNMIDAYQALADLLFNVKHLLPAAKLYELALERAPNRLPLLHNLARARLMLKEAGPTEALARRILSIDDRSVEAMNDLAWALLYRGHAADVAEALDVSERAIALAPTGPHVLVLRERALHVAGRHAEARALWARILDQCAADWDRAKPYCEAYAWLNQADRARGIIEAFVAARPDRPDGLRGLAMLVMGAGDFSQAQELLDRAAEIAPGDMGVRMARGLNGFRLGDFKLGLELYHSRWHRDNFDKPWNIPVPEWDGGNVDGRLLVYSEQGIGDYVMYALLFKELRQHARSITIEVNPRIASLFRRSFPDMSVIDRNSLPPNWNPVSYSAKVAMGDLPLRLGADMERLPHREGFLIPEPTLALKLRERYRSLYPDKRLVGISWRSGNRDSATIRSIDLRTMKAVFEAPDCAFISLQYGDIARDLDMLKAETGHEIFWDREIDPLHYVDPFAAQIAAMDMIISVDNSTVHFAGAIGIPCWVMLPLNSDWRWLTGRSTSIWYDSLELFRQQGGEGWEVVVAAVAARLRALDPDALVEAQARMCLRNGEEMRRRGDMATAESYYRWLLMIGREVAAAMHGIGLAARKAGKFSDAAAILGRAVELAPDRLDYRAEWAVALHEAGEGNAAERMARELTRQSDDPTALMAMGHILVAKGLLDQATDYFARVLRDDPSHVLARAVLAGLQAKQGEDALAHRNFARLVQQAPDLPVPRTALAEIDLRNGRDEAAGPNFAWRFGTAPEELPRHLAMIAPDDRPKSWSGGKIRRRRLFLRAERNALEQLLFAPWLRDVQQDSRSVRAECAPATLPLLNAAFPEVRFAGAGALTPDDLIADRTQIAGSLGDLVPFYARRSAGGWLPFDPAAAASRRRELLAGTGARRLVGLAWQVDNSPGLQAFAALFASAGIRWVALPMGAVAPALAEALSAHDSPLAFPTSWPVEDLESAARLLAALDLVISTEDLAATLAGALGKPVWKIAGIGAHWSWLAQGSESKWHPTARIYRAAAGLGPLMAELRADLEHSTEAASGPGETE